VQKFYHLAAGTALLGFGTSLAVKTNGSPFFTFVSLIPSKNLGAGSEKYQIGNVKMVCVYDSFI